MSSTQASSRLGSEAIEAGGLKYVPRFRTFSAAASNSPRSIPTVLMPSPWQMARRSLMLAFWLVVVLVSLAEAVALGTGETVRDLSAGGAPAIFGGAK